ncbi:hypothetical protein HLH33_17640 [Gluconacetobacter diazotrophicus]|uniref:Uncharacterized protein n=1 Tax=Gluconacetobacter diazotrophicus TaxID=33996 RepID=A0A7W4NI04_GLUDI|nr:hypothetical protein [Gluconacetobacter diazotrophicus]
MKLIRIDTVKVGDESIQAPIKDKTHYENAIVLARGQAASFDVPVAGDLSATIILSRPA